MKKGTKRILYGVGIIAIGAFAFGLKYLLDVSEYKQNMATVEIRTTDITKLDDSVYVGSYDAKIIAATVEVTVAEGMIKEIVLVDHKYDHGGPAVEVIDEIIANQTLEVDVVSGATNSSKTILKAVENALGSEPIR
ncbi:MAG: FMN-binding protein [Erysipelotrichales bacterium]|nr:MAG: FMN-binding protein [Erysipelotrichales bacterium]